LSKVEVAYDLLLNQEENHIVSSDNSDAQEEFADQCRVFASLLSELSSSS